VSRTTKRANGSRGREVEGAREKEEEGTWEKEEEESDVMQRDQLFGSVSHLGSATLSTHTGNFQVMEGPMLMMTH
jgi:hypothetical protein